MSTDAPSPPTDATPKGGEISLEDLDQLLENEDPGFTQSLEKVREVQVEESIEIAPSAIDMDDVEAASVPTATNASARPRRGKLKLFIGRVVAWSADMARAGVRQFLVFMRTRPREVFFYLLSTIKVLLGLFGRQVTRFRGLTLAQKLASVALAAVVGLSLVILKRNTKGSWLPPLTPPILRGFETYANFTETYTPSEEDRAFSELFPQERHEFLFGKMKVNLKRSDGHPVPMGAFEFTAVVDSKDTAIELSDREVEFSDLTQRVFEDESFDSLESEAGKGRLKSQLKRDLNQKLTQGWVKDINFKTFILKP